MPNVNFDSKPEGDYEVFNLKIYDINNFAILEKTESKNLLIYCQGSNGNPYNHNYFLKLKEIYKNKNFDILSLSLPGLGYNEDQNNFNFPGYNKDRYSDEEFLYNRAIWGEFNDSKYPKKNPLSIYLTANYYLINNIIDQYDHVEMIGISGGGWFTTILSSLITKINLSYSFSGTMPSPFNIYYNNFGNWAAEYSKMINNYSYWDFYYLSTLSDNGKVERNHYQIYNDEDRYWGDPAASLLKKYFDTANNNHKLKIIVNKHNKHEIDLKFFNIF